MGTAKGGYEGFWDKRLDFMESQASVAACQPSPGFLKRNSLWPRACGREIARPTLQILRNPGRAFLLQISDRLFGREMVVIL
jgi:hypothetical protein